MHLQFHTTPLPRGDQITGKSTKLSEDTIKRDETDQLTSPERYRYLLIDVRSATTH